MTCSSPNLPLGSRGEGADAVTCEKITEVLTVSMVVLLSGEVSCWTTLLSMTEERSRGACVPNPKAAFVSHRRGHLLHHRPQQNLRRDFHTTGTQKPRKALPNQEERLSHPLWAWASHLPSSRQTLVLTQNPHSEEGTSDPKKTTNSGLM